MRVCLVGHGAMGHVIENKLIEKGHTISGIISLGEIEDINDVKEEFDVIIDFSHPSNLDMLLDYVTKTKKPIVIATTGFSEEQKNAIFKASEVAPIVYTANFSLGITVMEEVLRNITPILEKSFDIEVIEKHHNKKIDAPSGTAKMLVEAINGDHRYEVVEGRSGVCKRGKEIGVSAIRGGTIVGEHSVIYAGEDEILEIKHEAFSKNIFANGAIVAAEYLTDKPAGLSVGDAQLFTQDIGLRTLAGAGGAQ